jgi:transposase-like protein
MSTTANQLNNNPPCPNCQGKSWRDGFKSGKQRYKCSRCRRSFRLSDKLNINPPCPRCNGKSKYRRLSKGRTVYLCCQCNRLFPLPPVTNKNPLCPVCNGYSRRRGQRKNGTQRYRCNQCGKCFSKRPRQQRQHQAQLQCEQLPALIEEKLPKNLPLEIREELQQELVVAALAGDFELSELDAAVARFRRKVNRESLTGFGYVSLDAVIPQTNGLTYADTLAG